MTEKQERQSIVINFKDSLNRHHKVEFWFYQRFVAIHHHGWCSGEEIKKMCTVWRPIWGAYYYTMEVAIPWFVFQKLFEGLTEGGDIASIITSWINSFKELSQEIEE